MSLLDKIAQGLADSVEKAPIVEKVLAESYVKFAKELDCNIAEIWVMLKPSSVEGKSKFYLYKNKEKIREVTIYEVLGEKDPNEESEEESEE